MPPKTGIPGRICGQTYWKWEDDSLNFRCLVKKSAKKNALRELFRNEVMCAR
jgi:hypothetical protein